MIARTKAIKGTKGIHGVEKRDFLPDQKKKKNKKKKNNQKPGFGKELNQ